MKEHARKSGGAKVVVTAQLKAEKESAALKQPVSEPEPMVLSRPENSSKAAASVDKKKSPVRAEDKKTPTLMRKADQKQEPEAKKESPVAPPKNPFAKASLGASEGTTTKAANVFGAFAETQSRGKKK